MLLSCGTLLKYTRVTALSSSLYRHISVRNKIVITFREIAVTQCACGSKHTLIPGRDISAGR
jgi:hypothetical protein